MKISSLSEQDRAVFTKLRTVHLRSPGVISKRLGEFAVDVCSGKYPDREVTPKRLQDAYDAVRAMSVGS